MARCGGGAADFELGGGMENEWSKGDRKGRIRRGEVLISQQVRKLSGRKTGEILLNERKS